MNFVSQIYFRFTLLFCYEGQISGVLGSGIVILGEMESPVSADEGQQL